ncbi:putative reverse transcriptase domain-containing protein [Tanacetum coccineum]
MSNMSEDIQYASSDTRPPMLDRTDFESWQQRIRLYCLGKDNGENIMKSITEGPERARVFADLSAEQKDRYKADIRATNILLQGSELTKDDRESQLYDEFEHFCQIKGETIHVYYVRFTKLINDMRNIKMTMSRMQLNSKFVNNMLPEWSRFITEVKLNRGLKESNFDQLYAYLKQHEVHANENKMMMERFIQPTNDPLALVSNASVQQYPTQSSMSPQSSNEPSPAPADNFQLHSGSSSTEYLIESLTNTLALLNQSFKAHLPQMNNQLRTSSNARNNDSDYYKDKMLLMNAHENWLSTDEEHLKTMQEVIEFTTELMEDKTQAYAERQAERKRKNDDLSKNNQNQQNKRQNTGQAYTAGNSDRKSYAGSKPLCSKCNYNHEGPCPPRCNNCKRVGHLARDCRSRPANANNNNNNNNNNRNNNNNNQQGNGCFECGAQGHFKRNCPRLRNNDRGNQAGNDRAPAKVYVVGNAGANPDNVVAGTFLLNNRYAYILFDTGADRSFVSTTFSSQIDITPSTLDHYYDVELADGRIIGLNTILKGCTLNFLNHQFNINLMPVELGSFDAIIGMDWLAKYQAVIVCAEKIVRIPWRNKTLIIHGDGSTQGNVTRLNIISCTKTQKYMEKGFPIFLAHLQEVELSTRRSTLRTRNQPIELVREEDIPKTAYFRTRNGHYEIKLLPLVVTTSKRQHEEHTSEENNGVVKERGVILPSFSLNVNVRISQSTVYVSFSRSQEFATPFRTKGVEHRGEDQPMDRVAK